MLKDMERWVPVSRMEVFFNLAVFGENLKYCYNLDVVDVTQKLRHFAILLKIFTWYSEYVFTIKHQTAECWHQHAVPLFVSLCTVNSAKNFGEGSNVFTAFRKNLNSSPNENILDCLKLKAFADYKINVTEKLKFILGRVENIVGKGENAGYQHFLFFLQFFQKAS